MLATKADVLVYMGRAGSATDADLALLDLLAPSVDAAIKSFLQQAVEYQQHIEYLPIGAADRDDPLLEEVELQGTRVIFHGGPVGTEALQLKHLPVLSTGLEVREDVGAYAGQSSGAFPESSVLAKGTDYYLDMDDPGQGFSRTGILYRFGTWPTEPRSIKVTYYAGFTESQLMAGMAADLRMASILTVAAWFEEAKARRGGGVGPKTSESIGKYSYTNGMIQGYIGGGLPTAAKHLLQPYRNYGRYVC